MNISLYGAILMAARPRSMDSFVLYFEAILTILAIGVAVWVIWEMWKN